MNRTIIYVSLLICAAVFSALGVSVVARSGNELIIDPRVEPEDDEGGFF